VPVTGGENAFRDVTVPAVYLNPGELSLLLYVDAPGFALNSFEFRPSAQPPSIYPAALAARTGVIELAELNGGSAGRGVLRNLGHIGSSATLASYPPGEERRSCVSTIKAPPENRFPTR